MPEQHNSYYNDLIKNFANPDDSIFEGCRIERVDMSTMTATIYGMRSKQTKGNVILLFPSLFLNTGIIAVPSEGSYALSFIAPTQETYVIPAQFVPPSTSVNNSKVKQNASPSQLDKLFSLEHLEPGEIMFSSKGGAKMTLYNNGSFELSTSKMNYLHMEPETGSLELSVDKKVEFVGETKRVSETIDSNGENIQYEKTEFTTRVSDDSRILSESELKMLAEEGVMDIEVTDGQLIYSEQKGMVYEGEVPVSDTSRAFSRKSTFQDGVETSKETLYLSGKRVINIESQLGKTLTVEQTGEHFKVHLAHQTGGCTIEVGETIVLDVNEKSFEVNSNGVFMTHDNQKFNVGQLIDAVNAISQQLGLPQLEGESIDG